MKLFTPTARRPVVALAAVIFISLASVSGQAPPRDAPQKAESQLNLLVLGDSILWGQGLKDEHKSWYQVKIWLQQSYGRGVRERIEAHSGALLVGKTEAGSVIPADSEINSAVPTVSEQLDSALSFFHDPGQVDLVLMDGCINDVSVFNLLNAGNPTQVISQLATLKCGQPMEELLKRTTKSFPNAHVIVTGYFPIISEKTPNSLLLRAVARLFYRQTSTPAPGIKTSRLRQQLVAISRAWYESSNQALAEAVRKTNEDLVTRNSSQRVQFVEIAFLPDYAFAAKETRLWGFNASFLRKLLAILTLGKVTLKTDDERHNQRVESCNDFFRRPQIEDKSRKREREMRRLLCYYASIGHPNRKGAEIYSEGIIRQLKLMITNGGWLRDLRTSPTPTTPLQ